MNSCLVILCYPLFHIAKAYVWNSSNKLSSWRKWALWNRQVKENTSKALAKEPTKRSMATRVQMQDTVWHECIMLHYKNIHARYILRLILHCNAHMIFMHLDSSDDHSNYHLSLSIAHVHWTLKNWRIKQSHARLVTLLFSSSILSSANDDAL